MNRRLGQIGLALVLLPAAGRLQAETCANNIPPSNPDAVYVDHGDGTVTDTRTSLTWKQCAEGLSGVGCAIGTALTYTWADALALAEASSVGGYNDWRLPNVKELRSLVEECREQPAINEVRFPNTPTAINGDFWTGSPLTGNGGYAWFVAFDSGYTYYADLGEGAPYVSFYVRLVRGGR